MAATKREQLEKLVHDMQTLADAADVKGDFTAEERETMIRMMADSKRLSTEITEEATINGGMADAKAFLSQLAAPAKAKKEYKDLTVCYPQLGAESDWRTANSASLKETASKLGVKLVFSDAQQKQENQISAMRTCIQQGVDVIALPPVVEDGWDAVLTEAKDAVKS